MQSTKSELHLPVGDKPFWDTDSWEEEGSITSISDSCVVSHSLRQSRDRWLFRTFPKFSSKTRGSKTSDVVPPPHTIQTRGKCDLEIGPHIFTDTVVYEVHYLSQGAVPGPSMTNNPVRQTNVSHGGPPSVTPQKSTPSAPATTPDNTEQENVPTPLISSLAEVTSITPILINRVNTAASANPILSNLLQLAAAGHANPDQLKTLGLLIQSLANMEELPVATASLQQPATAIDHYQRLPPVKDFDLVLEFREAPAERWVFPRVPVYGERKPTPSTTDAGHDILLTTCIPFNTASNAADDVSNLETSTETSVQYAITLRLKEAPSAVWDTIYRWIGGEDKLRSNKTQIDSIIPPKRMFLGHQLPSGSLLAQLQMASAPSYTMKTLKHGPTVPPRSSRQKKAYTQRKQTENGIKNNVSDTNNDRPAATKTARTSQSKSSSPIRCVSCNQTDVPLILGGRFCRPCVDSGQGTTNPAHAFPPPLQRPTS